MIYNQIVVVESNKRDFSIDILKCLAALLITWSHMGKPLGDYSYLATGGGLGDGLFFFCSGYALFLSQKGGTFLNWYKRRINRIYPTVFAWAFILCVFFSWNHDFLDVLACKGYWFVPYIMMFYVPFYLIKKYASNKHLIVVIAVTILLSFMGYCFVDHSIEKQEYTWMYWSFITVMLMGGWTSKMKKSNCQLPLENLKPVSIFLFLVSSFVLYYVFSYIEGTQRNFLWLRPLNMIFICGFAYFLYLLCNISVMKRLYDNKVGYAIIMTIGGLCLEIYLVQIRIITDKINMLFPLNLVVILLGILVAAYLLRCLARIWEQTFKDADYNWKQITKLY